MARTWTEAQQKERAFWQRVYVERREDIKTYTPIDIQNGVDFARKTLLRHRLVMDDIDGSTVADIGCGPYGVLYGMLHTPFRERPRLIGVDPLMDFYVSSIGLVTREQVELYQGQAESIPLPDSSCDYVFCVNALDHVEHPEQATKELARITKRLCLVSLHTVKPLFGPVHPVLKYLDSNHPHHFTVVRVRRILAAHFDAVRVTHIATMKDDQPEFALKYFWRAKNRSVALLRWMSTLVLQSVYFNCEKS